MLKKLVAVPINCVRLGFTLRKRIAFQKQIFNCIRIFAFFIFTKQMSFTGMYNRSIGVAKTSNAIFILTLNTFQHTFVRSQIWTPLDLSQP